MVRRGVQANNLIMSQQHSGTRVYTPGCVCLWESGMKISFVAPHTSDRASSQHVCNPAEGERTEALAVFGSRTDVYDDHRTVLKGKH